MAKIAKKKNVDNLAGITRVISGIKREDVVDIADFGHYMVVILKDGAIFHAANGFEVRCKAWSLDLKGKATETSLFMWLSNLVTMKKESKGKENDMFPYTQTATYSDVLDAESIMTEANLTYPLVAFTDVDRASEFANKHLKWLKEQTAVIESVVNKDVSNETSEDMKKNFETGYQQILSEQAVDALKKESEV